MDKPKTVPKMVFGTLWSLRSRAMDNRPLPFVRCDR